MIQLISEALYERPWNGPMLFCHPKQPHNNDETVFSPVTSLRNPAELTWAL